MAKGYILLGLTGGIGSGKSTVTGMLSEMGARTIDYDILAREVMKPGLPAYKEIVKYFGQGVLDHNAQIDRNKLGEEVFKDPDKRKVLESITHPRMNQAFSEQLSNILADNVNCIVQAVVPLLIEAGMWEFFHKVLVVYVPRDMQVNRLIQRDKLSRDQAEARLQAQIPLEEKCRYADYVIYNHGSLSYTREQVENLWKELSQELNSSD